MKRKAIVLLQRGPLENFGFEEDLSTPHIEFDYKYMDNGNIAQFNSYENDDNDYVAMDYSKLNFDEEDYKKIKDIIKGKNIKVHVYKKKIKDPSKYKFIIYMED